ncbi:GDP-mannose 4,6-dehydratase [Beijerinckia sp. L45]|uniref:GDP-mannose 4,6-dehydratase n=1 Tax=Beijerinckia sp. L45 TaxID=1641855 RepID=UPI00131D7146|nr:GDP-mannose 4,6-dehydratase [Beijerinckia sp. L45]
MITVPHRILITGASGFVGTYVRRELEDRFPDATITGLGTPVDGEESPRGLIALDLTDQQGIDGLVRRCEADTFIHLAAQSSVAVSQSSHSATWTTNLNGSLNLALAIAKHAPNATLLFASTAEVYGASFLDSPVNETSVPIPMNAYAKSKQIAERMLMDVLPSSARLIIARPFNHTGPGQRKDFVLPSFARQIAHIEAGLQIPEMLVGNLEAHRDFLDVNDVVAAYVALLDKAAELPSRCIVNIASGTPRSIRDLLNILSGLSKRPFNVTIDPSRLRPIDLPVAYAEPSLLRALTGWSPRYGIDQTLFNLLEHERCRLKAIN